LPRQLWGLTHLKLLPGDRWIWIRMMILSTQSGGRSKRRTALALILPFVFISFLAFAAQLQARPSRTQGHRSAALETRSESSTTCVMGLQTGHPSLPGDAGACWIRVELLWDLVEPEENEPRSYDWTVFDAKLADMLQGDTSVIAVLMANPPWAAEYPGGPVTDTVHLMGLTMRREALE
jgi:hypothetical protein